MIVTSNSPHLNVGNEKLTKEISSLVAKIMKLPEEKIDPAVNIFAELGVDSLLGVEILASLDKKYNIDLPENQLQKITSINDLVRIVSEQLTKKK